MEPKNEATHSLQRAIDSCLDAGMTMSATKAVFEHLLLQSSLARAGNNQHALAEKEGIHRNTVARSMKRLNVTLDADVHRRHRSSRGIRA